MHLYKSRLAISSVCIFATLSTALEHPRVHNANHLFNAIHSSMRQWGSSLNHNGMSFFLATVPAGTQLYHGTSISEPVQGLEWLAFEPEHAMIFARPHGPPPDNGHQPPKANDVVGGSQGLGHGSHQYPPRPDGPVPGDRPGHRAPSGPGYGDGRPPFDDRPRHRRPQLPPPRHAWPPGPPPPSPPNQRKPVPRHPTSDINEQPSRTPNQHQVRRNQQHPLGPDVPDHNADVGYLHTYVPKHDLRLLYVDGLSAGKTSNGTLDTQDMLLLNLTLDPHSPMGGEHERARGMCNLTTTLWEGKVDGILRMEGGFEIILCDFAMHLERTDIIAVTEPKHWLDESRGLLGGWQYIKAVTRRYHGIGGDRVRLALDDFVSVFSYSDLKGLFKNDVRSDYAMPRLQNVKDGDRLRVKDDVTSMILRKDWDKEISSQNWQAIADLVVARYSKPLHHLRTNKQIRGDKDALEIYLINILHPFIDYTARNATLETQRCIAQVIPPLPTPPSTPASLAHRTVHTITRHICDTLLTALSIASASTSHASFTQVYAEHTTELIDNLVSYLNWTTWKDCGTCADEEVCYVPIWPMGNHEDHANPKCMDEHAARDRWGYWGQGRMGPPPPGEGDDGDRRHRVDMVE